MQSRELVFVGGEWIPPDTDRLIEVISPHEEHVIGRVAAPSFQDVDRAVGAARTAFDEGPWPRSDPAERVSAVRRLADLYARRREDLAQTVTAEMGAPITFSRAAHVRSPGAMMRALADIADDFPWREHRRGSSGGAVLLQREPLGVVAAVIPGNMPMFLALMKLVPALLAGCPVILKPPAETSLSACLLADLLVEAGLPPGLVSILPGDGALGAYLVSQFAVDKVFFTGSTMVGWKVAAECGTAFKPVSLELGGKSAAVVLDDADPAEVAAGLKVAGLMNSGQSATAQTRILVPRHRQGAFVEALASMVGSLVVGDPADPATEVGPLATRGLRDRIRGSIDRGRREGARLLVGGDAPPDGLDRGWYVRPTLFTDVDSDMRIAQDEIFGPVLTVIPYHDEEDAVRIADDTQYGLSASVWTRDLDRGLAVAGRIRSGTVGINQPYSMDPIAPFGGVKESGTGRELGREGIEAYLDIKAISIATRASGVGAPPRSG